MQKQLLSILLALLCFIAGGPAATANAIKAPKSLVGESRPQLTDLVTMQLSTLSLEEKVGQLFILDADMAVQALPAPAGGYILFSRHTPSKSETLTLTQQLRYSSPRLPPFIAVDQEGGRVARLSFISKLPAARQLAALRPETVARIGWLLGQELSSLGFNLNFAPVVDVATRNDNPVIGDRSFSSDPIIVAKLTAAFIKGLQSAGVSATAKHFPGHGDTRTDSHLTLPIVDHSRERLEHVELLPFQAAVNSKVDMVMIGHLHLPVLDPSPDLPATLSRPIVTGVLREQLGYEGIIITDAMNMRAVSDGFDSGQAAVMAFKAGVDIILMPTDYFAAYNAMLEAVQTGDIPQSRLDDSLRRILSLKQRMLARHSVQEQSISLFDNVGSLSHRIWLEKLLRDKIEYDAEPRN
jgi:beta-N-acetylhexosaminidase